jgi:hypothetical protein
MAKLPACFISIPERVRCERRLSLSSSLQVRIVRHTIWTPVPVDQRATSAVRRERKRVLRVLTACVLKLKEGLRSFQQICSDDVSRLSNSSDLYHRCTTSYGALFIRRPALTQVASVAVI